MACAVPVITTTASSLPEVAGDAAVLVEPDDISGMAAAMNRCLASPIVAEMRAAGVRQLLASPGTDRVRHRLHRREHEREPDMKRDVRTWMPWVTVVTDAVLINIALAIAYWLRYDLQLFRSVDPANNVPYSVYLPMAVLMTLIVLLSNWREGAYNVRATRSVFGEWYAVITSTPTAIALLVIIVFFYRRCSIPASSSSMPGS
jgi:hypothetical protein